MILTTYIDESGTHSQAPITVMAGYVATTDQWERFEADWTALIGNAGVQHIHAVDLSKRTRQFKGWKAEDANKLFISLDGVIATHLPIGFAVIVRDDDYRSIYGAGPHPKRPQKDTKYGICFRACLAFVPSYIASALKLAHETTINFVLEDGHRNIGDAQRIFDLYKADALPEWEHLVGTMDVSRKDSPGAQAADFLAYTVYRAECIEHGQATTAIENSSYVADGPLSAGFYPQQPVPQRGPAIFRIPISREILQSLKDDLFAIEADRRAKTTRRA